MHAPSIIYNHGAIHNWPNLHSLVFQMCIDGCEGFVGTLGFGYSFIIAYQLKVIYMIAIITAPVTFGISFAANNN